MGFRLNKITEKKLPLQIAKTCNPKKKWQYRKIGTPYTDFMFSAVKPVWLGGKDAGIYAGRSRDWIEIRALAWEEEWIRGRIRYQLDVDSGDRRYLVADLDRLQEPPRKHKALPRRLPVDG